MSFGGFGGGGGGGSSGFGGGFGSTQNTNTGRSNFAYTLIFLHSEDLSTGLEESITYASILFQDLGRQQTILDLEARTMRQVVVVDSSGTLEVRQEMLRLWIDTLVLPVCCSKRLAFILPKSSF